MIVPTPSQFPNACLACTSQKGPIWYGGTVTSAALALYICRTCAEGIAREYGLTEGEEMDRLRGAAEELAQKEREAEKHAREMYDAAILLDGVRAELREAKEALDAERGKVATMEHAADDMKRYAAQIGGGGQITAGVPVGVTSPDPED